MLSRSSRRVSRTSTFQLRLVQNAVFNPHASHVHAFEPSASFRWNFRLFHDPGPPEPWHPGPVRPKLPACTAFTILANSKLTVNTLSELNEDLKLTKRKPREDILRLISSSTAYSKFVTHRPETERGLVILATPSFTSWLEDKSFISEMIHTVFSVRNHSSIEPMSVSVLAGVVDGLPASVGWTNPMCDQPAEGLAFLFGDCSSLLPGLWNSSPDASQKGITDPAYKQSITFFSTNPNLRPSYPPFNTEFPQTIMIDVTVPLANTLFRNGRDFTLLASKWQRAERTSSFKLVHHDERQSQRINVKGFGATIYPSLWTPLTILTPTRSIASSLGNIVSQILDNQGKPIPASRELEATIDDYLEAKKVRKQAVTVWALVIPEATYSRQNKSRDEFRKGFLKEYSESPESLCSDTEVIRKFWVAPPNKSSYAGRWVANGASLHRILSGGGGWGAKQGLLSLDPDTSLVTTPNARWDFDKHGIWEDDHQRKALGDIAKAGSMIQFLVAHEPSEPPSFAPDDSKHLDLVVGCIPSTIDDMPSADGERNDAAEGHKKTTSPQRIDGHFGAQSETGFFIQHSVLPGKNQPSTVSYVRSKIDVPHSIWVARRRL